MSQQTGKRQKHHNDIDVSRAVLPQLNGIRFTFIYSYKVM